MMSLKKSLLLALVAMLVGTSVVMCDDAKPEDSADAGADSDLEEEDINDLEPSTDAETTTLFPDYPEGKVPQAVSVDTLIGLANTGSRKFNVTRIWGSLHSALEYKYNHQNFSISLPNSIVEPNEQGTFYYPFLPHSSLEAREYILTIDMLYEDDENTKYRSSVYNATIEIVEAPGTIDVKQIMTYLMIFGVVAGLLSLVYQYLAPKKRRSSKPSAPSAAAADDDWTTGRATKGSGKKNKKA